MHLPIYLQPRAFGVVFLLRSYLTEMVMIFDDYGDEGADDANVILVFFST